MKLESFKEKDMKKKGIIIFTICCVLLIAGVFFSSSFALFETKEVFNLVSGNVKDLQDISFTYYVDHQIVKDAPEKGSGKLFDEVSSTCTNDASVRWNYESWSPIVTDWNHTKTKCSIYFNTAYSEDILNGSFPALKNGLLPITIKNDGLVKKADTTSKWYSYEEKNWANAVITRSSYDGLQENGNISGVTKQDGYASFDGVDDYVNLGLENYDFGNSVTIAIKVKLYDGVYDSTFNNFDNSGFGFQVLNNKIEFAVYNEEEQKYIFATGPEIKTEEIYTFVGSYDGSNLKLYVNGELVAITPNKEKIKQSPFSIYLGANPSTKKWRYDRVDIYQASLFHRALTEEEIKENYKDIIHVKNEEGLLRYVDFTNREYEVNEVIPEESIESYFVWIPRYRYKIFNEGNYQTLSETLEQKEKTIEIEFENKDVIPSTGVSVGEWLTHPAFTSFNSNGMWVGKFETSKGNDEPDNSINPSGIEIKPNRISWQQIQVGNAFYTSYNYKRNLDSHMMKNTEWGAVAYLTNSSYGINSNMRMNNNDASYTGYAANFEPTCGYIGTNSECNRYCSDGTCNEPYNTTTGYLASTTGNITGIYDMSGGAWEYVMGVITDQNGNLVSGINNTYHSGFIGVFTNPSDGSDPTKTSITKEEGGLDWPERKYYDLYPYSTTAKEFQRRILGDATGEMGPFIENVESGKTNPISSWYKSVSLMVSPKYPWAIRGGSIFYGNNASIFTFDIWYGGARGYSFRVVLT